MVPNLFCVRADEFYVSKRKVYQGLDRGGVADFSTRGAAELGSCTGLRMASQAGNAYEPASSGRHECREESLDNASFRCRLATSCRSLFYQLI